MLRNTESTEQLRTLVGRLGEEDLMLSLGGDWTVGFAFAHLAFWDARQVAALKRYAHGDGFAAEDYVTNWALESIASAFDPTRVGEVAVRAAEQLDAVVKNLSGKQVDDLRAAGLLYAIDRAPHREEHIQQIQAALG